MQDTDFLERDAQDVGQPQSCSLGPEECIFGAVSLSKHSGVLAEPSHGASYQSVDIFFVHSGVIRTPQTGAIIQGAGAVVIVPGGQALQWPFLGETEATSVTSVLRDQAMAVIAQRCADRELNPEAVARAVQSSLRRVQAAFAEVGNSIAAEIRRQRGRLAWTLLADARYDVLSVQQIAEQAGFGTTAALRRVLDELYGCGPTDLRERRSAG